MSNKGTMAPRMLLRFLGTSAGELYPGLWCRCSNCQRAREGTDRDRRQSAALAVAPNGQDDPTVLIDFPSEIADQCRRHRVDLTRLEHLLVTHSHGDHWFPYLLRWRMRPAVLSETPSIERGGPRFTPLPLLHVYGNEAVEAILRRELGSDLTPYEIAFHPVAGGDRFQVGELDVTALPANHDVGRENAVHYVLRDETASVLYGLDGDTFLPETRAALSEFQLDAVILESTYGFGNGGNHRNFARVIEEADWFRQSGALKPEGRILATHFSPHHCPPHEETEAYLRTYEVTAVWDGYETRVGEEAE
jgi:phosphoribosyl 1,2-cyclic phosphate phosphodiesterase